MESETLDIDHQLGASLKAARLRHDWTLEALAARTGVSRAMISRIERGESSPTAALLVKLTAGLGVSLSSLFAQDRHAGPIARLSEQPVWRDPDSHYQRRNVSPPGTGSAIDLVDVAMPPGARVVFETPPPLRRGDQQVWVLDGVLELTVAGVLNRLETGDCMHMHLDQPIIFHNPGRTPLRYAVALTLRDGRFPENDR